MFSYSFLLVLAPLLAAQMGNSCQCQSTTYSFNGQCYCDQSAVMVISCIQRMKPTAFMMTLPTNNSSTTIEYNPTAKDESNKRLRKRQDPQAGQQPQNPFQQQPTGQQMGPSSGMSPTGQQMGPSSGMSPFQQQPGGQAGTSPFQQPFPGQQQGPQTSGISPFQQQPGQPGQQPGMGMPQPGQPQPGQPQPGQPQSGQSGGQPGQSNSVEQQCIQQTGAKPSGSSGTPNKPSSATSSNQLPKIVLTMGVLTFIL